MATVGTNDRLHDRVTTTTNAFKTGEKGRLEKQFLRHLPSYGDEIYETLVGEKFLRWYKDAPPGIMPTARQLTIMNIGKTSINLTLPLQREIPAPHVWIEFPNGKIDGSFRTVNAILNEKAECWQSLLEPARILEERRDRVEADIRNLNVFVRKLFGQHSSLGPCLRAWPALWEILHVDDRSRQGAKPYGAQVPIPAHVATEEEIRGFTATVMRIKMGVR